jgi:Ser/Thr protein kinase RdoA (MazF antagonist)
VIRTPAVLPAPDGSRVVAARVGDQVRHTVRFAWVDGDEPAGPRLVDDFATLGAIAARLHAHTKNWSRPGGFTRFTWDCDTAIGERGHWGRWQDGIAVRSGEHAVLDRLAARLRHRLAAFGAGPDRFGLVHADLRLANLLVRAGSDELTVIDFDDSGFGWYLYDLGASLSFIEDDPRVPELIDAWVSGYRSMAPLSNAEAAELPTFVMLRRLLLVAWIGSHAETELAQRLGPQFTIDSCDLAETYLSHF